jgi:hypothetical protein
MTPEVKEELQKRIMGQMEYIISMKDETANPPDKLDVKSAFMATYNTLALLMEILEAM